MLWTFFVSGLMSLALEIIWFRTLVIFLRPTAYAFTIMLACVLAGIALGSAIAAPLLRMRRDWMPILAAIQCVIGFAAVLSFNMLARAQQAIDAATPWFERLGLNTYLAPLVVSSLIAMLPTTILLGLAFPIGLTLWAGDSPSDDTSRKAGTFYSLNVLGAILGSVARRLHPAAAARHALEPDRGRGAGDGVEHAARALRAEDETGDGDRASRVVAPLLFLIGARAAVGSVRRRLRALSSIRIAGVARGRRADDGRGSRSRRQSADARDVPRRQSPGQRFAGRRVRPPSHRRAAGDAASESRRRRSSSASAAAPRPARSRATTSHVDVVELSKAVVAGSDHFKHINFNLLERPNVTLHVDDGRNFLMMSRKKYDVITADIILPRHAGAGIAVLARVLRAGARCAGRWRPGDAVERRRFRRRNTSC